MNSFASDRQSLRHLQRYPELESKIPLSFVQHRFPRIDLRTREPFVCPGDPESEWNPPGHGEIYSAMAAANLIQRLLNEGIEHLFVSNIDNLGASLDPTILGRIVSEQIPFLMEVTQRTPMDCKGGHCARLRSGGLVLRELSQCPPEDLGSFQDINRHRYFNTNNLWISLPFLQRTLGVTDNMLDLPLIINRKEIALPSGSKFPIAQLESAMGAAISIFQGSRLLPVPRSRFVPVKKCADLLSLRSNRYELTTDYRLEANPSCESAGLSVNLDPRYFGTISEFEERFVKGVPSMTECSSVTIKGNVYFGSRVKLAGSVSIDNRSDKPLHIPNDAVVSGDVIVER